MSAHANSAPGHEDIQGRQFTHEEFEKLQNQQPFKDITGRRFAAIKRPIGMWNCGHYVFEIIIGANQSTYDEKKLQLYKAKNAKGFTYEGYKYTGYEAEQMLHKIRNEWTKTRGALELAGSSGDMELAGEYQRKMIILDDHYLKFNKAMQIFNAEPLTNFEESGIIDRQSEAELRKNGSQNSEFSVRWDAVDTKKYVDTFQKVEPKPQISKELVSSSRAILEHRNGTNYEDYRLIDARTGKIVAIADSPIKEAQVNYSEEVKSALNSQDDKRYISIHNHPKSSPPSAADLNALRRNTKVDYGIIVGHDGTIIKYTAPNAEIDRNDFIDRQKKYVKHGYTLFTAHIKALEELQKIYKFRMEVFENGNN